MELWHPKYVITDIDAKEAVVSMSEVTVRGTISTTTRSVRPSDTVLEPFTRSCFIHPDGYIVVKVSDILSGSNSCQTHRLFTTIQRAVSMRNSRYPSTDPSADLPDAFTALEDDEDGSGAPAVASLQTVGYTPEGISSRSVRALTRTRRRRITNEDVLIDTAVNKCLDNFHNLISTALQELRVVHFFFERREAALLTIRANEQLESAVHYVCFMWQYTSSPPKAVCVTMFLKNNGDINSEILARCTCGPYSSGSCPHIAGCFRNERFTDLVRSALMDKENDQNYYGSVLQPEASMPLAQLVRASSQRSPESEFIFSLHRTWSFWVTFDRSRGLFVPIMKRRNLAFQCQLCRGSAANRGFCSHECQARQTARTNNAYDILDGDDEDGAANPEVNEDHNNPTARSDSRLDAEVFLYCPTHLCRPVLPCTSEQQMSDVLYHRLRSCSPQQPVVHLVDAHFHCVHCKEEFDLDVGQSFKRKGTSTLLTLEEGPKKVQMYDWTCPGCCKTNYYSGRYDSIFPVRRKVAYTTDYLYCLVDLTCRLGMSQRVAYEAINIVGRVSKQLLRFERLLNIENADGSPQDRVRNILQRRRVNEALGLFMMTLTLGKGTGQELLFTCSTCEENLTEEDRNTLGITEEEAAGKKRYRGIVIDGTSCGVLNALPKIQRACHKIPAPKRVGRKSIVTKKVERKATKSFLTLASNHLKWSMKDCNNNRSWFWLLQKKGGVERPHLPFIKMLFRLSNCTCFPDQSQLQSQCRDNDASHDESCEYFRFKENPELIILSDILLMLFRLELRSGTGDSFSPDQDLDSDEDESVDDDSSDAHATEDAVAGNTTEDIPPELGSSSDDAANPLPLASATASAPRHGQDQSSAGSSETLKWAVCLRVDSPRQVGQLLHRLLKGLDFYSLDNLLLVYLTPTPTVKPEIGDGSDPNAQFLEPGRPNFRRKAIMKGSKSLHHNVLRELKKLAECSHHSGPSGTINHSEEQWEEAPVCVACARNLLIVADQMEPTNPILSGCCIELAECSRNNPSLSRNIANALIKLVVAHMDLAEKLCERLDELVLLPSGAKWRNYYDKFDGINISALDDDADHVHGYETGIVFPAMKHYRDYVVFESGEQFDCGKRYGKSKWFSPGILTVQCCCSKPQLLGYIVMRKAESTALAMSASICCFQIPPRNLYYDNGCNLLLSMIQRMPALTHQSKVVIDRFHNKNHTCSAFFTADSYRRLDNDKTTTAESINARIEKSVPFIRYLSGDHLIPFLNIRFALLNVATRYRRSYNKDDLEDEDLWTFFKDTIPCPCLTCTEAGKQFLVHRDVSVYGLDREELLGIGQDVQSNSSEEQDTTSPQNEQVPNEQSQSSPTSEAAVNDS